jgi:ArsR family transcriptional regulator
MLNTESFFRALADQTRLRCLVLMHRHGELCVCELTHALGLSQPKISRHLAYLRDAGVVADRRQGVWVYYRVRPDLPAWAMDVLAASADGLAAAEPFRSDGHTLAQMPNRPGAPCCA